MRIYDKIVEDIYEPQNTSVLWLRSLKDGFAFYRFINGKWEALKMMDDKGTMTPEDDTEIDLDNIPTMDTIDEKIQTEVTKQIGTQVEDEVSRQIAGHDAAVHDTHNAPSSNTDEYPEVNIL